MEVDKEERQVLQRALDIWEQAGKITPIQGEELRNDLYVRPASGHQLARYFFFIAIFCILLAFGALFLNEKLLERLKQYFLLSDAFISFASAMLAIVWLWYTRRKLNNTTSAGYEVNMTLGGLAILTSLVYLCKPIERVGAHTVLLTLAVPALALPGYFMRSRALWLGGLAALTGWYWSFSSWLGSDNLFLGMNYPLRFVVLGVTLIVVALLMRRKDRFADVQPVTYFFGLAVFFISFWAVSVFGNYNTIVGWQQVRQVHVLAYSLLFGVVTVGILYFGVKYQDDLVRDFALLFLLLNLYTRYFEYFWDAMNKGLFFLVLAITFALLGRWLERRRRAAH